MRTQSQSETARELGISQIRVREALVQHERNIIRGRGEKPPTLKRMQQGDVTTRFDLARDLRGGRPAIHTRVDHTAQTQRLETAPTMRIEVTGASTPPVVIVTAVDDDSRVHRGFLHNLEAYARWLHGELRIQTFGPASGKHGSFGRDQRRPNTPTSFGDRIELRSDVTLPRYARYPLDGLQRLAPDRSAVLLHATPQLESLPRLSSQKPRIQITSGLASLSRRVIGPRVVDELEPLGAVIITASADGGVNMRRISSFADGEGSFHDLDVRVADGRIETGVRVDAIVFGDIHYPQTDSGVISATWGEGGLVDRLRPRHQVLHDVVEFHARSHHDVRDHHAHFARFARGRDDVRKELTGVGAFLASTRRRGCTTHVVASNHDQGLVRWLREGDFRQDPRNAEFRLFCERLAYQLIRDGENVDLLPEVLRSLVKDRLAGVEFIADGATLRIAGIEHALHGDRGPDGKRGSVAYLESMGFDMTIGHFHRPTIRGGVYVAGLCSDRIGYERGPTTRAIAHVITHADGTRQHVFYNGGRFVA